MTEREKSKILDRLIEILREERGEPFPELPEDRKADMFRALRNVRPPAPVSAEFVALQDAYLKECARERGVVTVDSLLFRDGIAVYRGDITRLEADAIVNACNSALLGCFRPLHDCIDNVIHSNAGVQVRNDCYALTRGAEVENGGAEVTKAYNLPARFIFHTVGPCVGSATKERDRDDLKSCYNACLAEAAARNLSSIAFPCVSTGVYGYPQREAAEIAVQTAREFLSTAPNPPKIVFDVFSDADEAIYRKLLKIPK